MRNIDFKRAGNCLHDDISERLKALIQFPNDELSRRRYQAYLVDLNKDYFKSVKSYQVSAFDQSVGALLAKGIAERAAAGLIAIYLFRLLRADDPSPTKYKASKLASQFIADAKEQGGHKPLVVPWAGEKNGVRNFPIRSSQKNLTAAFDRYSSISTFAAAMLLKGLDSTLPSSASASKADAAYLLRIVYQLEKTLYPALPEYFSNAWQIGDELSVEVLAVDPPLFGAEFEKEFPLEQL